MNNPSMENCSLVFVGIGEVLWDLLPGGRQFGGAPANFAYHAKALGVDAQVVSCVGGDDMGDEILAYLDRLGLGHEHIAVDPEHPTGTVSVRLDAAGKPNYVIHEQVAWDFLTCCRRRWGWPRGPTPSVLARWPAVGRLTACDPRISCRHPAGVLAGFRRQFAAALLQRRYDRRGIEAADVLKLNDEELPVIARLLSIRGTVEEKLGTLYRRYNLKLIALTEGDRGSLLFSPGEHSRHAGHRTEVVDTVAPATPLPRYWPSGC